MDQFEFCLAVGTLVFTAAAAWGAIDAAKSGRKSADAAMEALDQAQQLGERPVRAYALLDKVEPDNWTLGKPIRLKVVYRNCGQTPALGVKIRASCKFISASEDWAAEPIGNANSNPWQGEMILPSNDTSEGDCIMQEIYDASTYNALVSGTHVIGFAVELAYRDVFGKTRRTEQRVILRCWPANDPSKFDWECNHVGAEVVH